MNARPDETLDRTTFDRDRDAAAAAAYVLDRASVKALGLPALLRLNAMVGEQDCTTQK